MACRLSQQSFPRNPCNGAALLFGADARLARLCEARTPAWQSVNSASRKVHFVMWNEIVMQCSKVFHYEKLYVA